MKKVQYGLLVLVAFFSLSAVADVLWQRPLKGYYKASTQVAAENGARSQLNMQISATQSQCQSYQGIGLVYGLQKTVKQLFGAWEFKYRVTMSCEK